MHTLHIRVRMLRAHTLCRSIIFRGRSLSHIILVFWAQFCEGILKLHSQWSYHRGECPKCGKYRGYHHQMDTKLKYVASLVVHHSEQIAVSAHGMLDTHAPDACDQRGDMLHRLTSLRMACTLSKFRVLFLLKLIWTNINGHFKTFNLIRQVP
jgi:hypothetical protein